MSTVIGRVSGILSMDTTQWRKGLREAEDSLKSSSAQIQSIGTRLGAAFTIPLAGAALVTSRFARTFQTTMTQVVTLADVSRKQVDRWGASLLAIGPSLGRGPNELAAALLKVTSAGERSAAALDIVQASAKASVVGLGETAGVADAVTSVLQAYAKAGLTAAQATDIMVATVREGKAEAPQLAGALGRVVGIASQLGVSFSQVGAFIATYTRLGVSAEEAATGLRSALVNILKPGEQAREALAEIGLTTDDLRRKISQEGLTQTLIELVQAFDGNEEALGRVIPDVQGLAGVLGTAGSQGASFIQVLRAIEGAVGVTNQTFAEATKDSQFTLDQFKASLEVVAVALGNRLAPSFDAALQASLPFINSAAVMAEVFGALPGPIRAVTIGLLGLLAAAGPLGFAVSGVQGGLAGLAALLGRSSVSFGRVAVAAAGLTGGVVALDAVVGALGEEAGELAPKIQEVEARVGDLSKIAKIAREPMAKLVEEVAKGVTRADLFAKAIAEVDKQLKLVADVEPVPTPGGTTPTPAPPSRQLPRPSGTPGPPPATAAERTVSRPTPVITPPPTPPTLPAPVDTRPGSEKLEAERSRAVQAKFRELEGPFIGPPLPPPKEPSKTKKGGGGGAGDFPESLQSGNIDKDLRAISLNAQYLGDAFDASAARVEFFESRLQDAADAGLAPTSALVQRLQQGLAAARADTSGMESDLARLAARAGEPGFDVMEAQMGRVTEEIDKLRGQGIPETDDALVGLKSRLGEIAAAAPGTGQGLASISRAAAAIGPSFDSTGAKITFLRERVRRLAEVGGDAAKGIRPLQEEIARLGLSAGPSGLQMETAAAQAGVFGDRQKVLETQLAGVGQQLQETTAAFVTARNQLGNAAPETEALRQRVEDLKNEYRGLSGELGKVRVDDAIGQISKQGTGTGFSLSALAGQGRQGPSPVQEVQGKISAQQQELATVQQQPIGLQDPAQIAALEENIAGLQQYEAALLGTQAVAQSVAGAIGSAFQQSAQGIIQGTLTVEEAFANMGINILISWGATLVEMLAMELANQALRLATEEGFLSAKLGLQAIYGQLEVAYHAITEGEKTGITLGGIAARIVGYGGELVAGITTAVGIATSFIGAAAGTGASWIATFAIMIAGFISTAAVGIAQAIGLAFAWIAPAAVAAFTALAAIPYVGPFLAFAAIAAVVGGLTALVLSFASGGAELTEDQLVYAHKRELILPADISTGLTSMIRSGKVPGESNGEGVTAMIRSGQPAGGDDRMAGDVRQLRRIGSVAPSTAFQAMQVTRGVQTRRRAAEIGESGRGGVTITAPLIQPRIDAVDSASVEDLFRRERATLVSQAMEELRLRLADEFR